MINNPSRMPSVLFFLLALTLICGCKGGAVKQEKVVTEPDSGRTSNLLARLQEINGRAVDSYSAKFTLEGVYGKNKFNTLGEARFNKNPRLARYTFFDIVFKSKLAILVQEGKLLKFYFPAEKTLYVDNTDTIDLSSYVAIDLSFPLVYPFAAGQIPIIEGFTIKQGLVAETDAERCYLLLENNDYFQTIGFKGDTPDKILFISKKTGKKTEFYLEKPQHQEGAIFYRKIRMLAPESGGRLTVSFSEIEYGVRIDSASLLRINLDRGARIVDMDRR